ncbi:hypothetical protein J5X84_42380 [Streptosporangiaceae bacterium NEAU-GS5]|nr:hypothetical protein [Streptosporangiaceae bacterium NEAU-GS5]
MIRHHPPAVLTPEDVQLETRGQISSGAADHARAMVAAITAVAHEPVLRARVRLAASADPAAARPFTAQAALELGGRLIHARAAAPTVPKAIHLLRERLRVRLLRTARDWPGRRRRMVVKARLRAARTVRPDGGRQEPAG